MQQQTKQQSELLAMHKAEFDALLEMSNRLTAVPPPPSVIAPGSPILNNRATSKEVAMNEDRKLTKAGANLIHHFEGCLKKEGDKYKAYTCPAGRADDRPRPHQPSRQAVQCNYSMDP